MIVSFGIVFFVLAKFGFPIIIKMVEERKVFIDTSLESARMANEHLHKINEESEMILKHARAAELHILKEADEMREKIIADARKHAEIEAVKLIAEAKTAIQKEKEMALHDIKDQIALLSISIAGKILRKNLDSQPAQHELVKELIEEVQKN
jgi:F-type H+-transporting ATPase subunit b